MSLVPPGDRLKVTLPSFPIDPSGDHASIGPEEIPVTVLEDPASVHSSGLRIKVIPPCLSVFGGILPSCQHRAGLGIEQERVHLSIAPRELVPAGLHNAGLIIHKEP